MHSALLVQVLSGGSLGKNPSPTPSPFERGSFTNARSASVASVHLVLAPLASAIEPEESTSSSRSTGTCSACLLVSAHCSPMPGGLPGGEPGAPPAPVSGIAKPEASLAVPPPPPRSGAGPEPPPPPGARPAGVFVTVALPQAAPQTIITMQAVVAARDRKTRRAAMPGTS